MLDDAKGAVRDELGCLRFDVIQGAGGGSYNIYPPDDDWK